MLNFVIVQRNTITITEYTNFRRIMLLNKSYLCKMQ